MDKRIHYTQKGHIIQKIVKVGKLKESLQLEYQIEEDKAVRILAETSALFHPTFVKQDMDQNMLLKEQITDFLGDIQDVYCWDEETGKAVIVLTQPDREQNYFSVPYFIKKNGEKCFHPDLLKQRVWERNYQNEKGSLICPLRFRIVPGKWPNIQLKAADMLPYFIT